MALYTSKFPGREKSTGFPERIIKESLKQINEVKNISIALMLRSNEFG